MTRSFILSLTAALPLLVTAGCGDNGGGTAGGSTGSTGGTSSTSEDVPTTDPSTTSTGATESGSTSTTGPMTEPTTTGADSTTDVSTTTGESDTGSTGMATGDPLAECLMMVEPDDMCGQCACMSCTMEFQDCQADMGCKAIFACVQKSGCTGPDCVGPCGQTINENGGLAGAPAAKAIALGMCIGNSCAMQCGG